VTIKINGKSQHIMPRNDANNHAGDAVCPILYENVYDVPEVLLKLLQYVKEGLSTESAGGAINSVHP
jgi:hypothetical protein